MAQNKLPLTEGNEKRNFKTNVPSQKMDIKNYIFL